MTELKRLRDKLVEIESKMQANRDSANAIMSKQPQLAIHRSECHKAIARLTLAREKVD